MYKLTGLSFEANIVYSTARACGLSDVQAKIIVSQAIHESANFKSNVFKVDNNAFGLKMPVRRSRLYIQRASYIVMRSEGSAPYAHYSTLENCVKDLLLGWHGFVGTDWALIKTPEQYAALLKYKGYYGDTLSNYTAAIRRTYKVIENYS